MDGWMGEEREISRYYIALPTVCTYLGIRHAKVVFLSLALAVALALLRGPLVG